MADRNDRERDDRGTSMAARRREDTFRTQRSQPGTPGSHFRREGREGREGRDDPPRDAVIEGKGLSGKIVKLIGDKGFGFIESTTGVRYFFHRSAVLPNDGHYENLFEGQAVTFDGIKSHKGPRCEQVQPIE